MDKNYRVKTLASLVWSISIMFLLNVIYSSCKEEPKLWDVNSTDQVASKYIAGKPEFSEFAKLVEVAGMRPLLGIRGPYTIMIPNNDAMFAFYKLKGVNSLMDLDEKFRNNLLRNHIITNEIPTGDMGLGAIRDTNAIGDFLVTEFQGADIILNKYSKIIDRDVRLANGYAHVIDQVIDLVTKDVYTVITEDSSYKIFAEGLRVTGLKDTLQLISFPYGNKTARTRFTIFAVPDTIYQSKGIQNVDDLIKWTGANPDSVTYLNNPFYRYMEYHCLNGTHYLSDLNTQLYPILSQDNNISLTVDTDYKINYIPKTKKYTAFIVAASNTPAKNGAIHAINGFLPVIEPDPGTIIFETTDFFDLKQKDCYGKYYQKWSDGKNTFAKIKWIGDFLQYYIKPSPNKNNDALNMLGWWELSVTFPKVMKGDYKISIYQPEGWFLSNCEVYLDGVKTDYTYRGPNGGGPGGLQQVAEGYFKTTTEHTLTLRNLDYGGCWWDYIKFEPLK